MHLLQATMTTAPRRCSPWWVLSARDGTISLLDRQKPGSLPPPPYNCLAIGPDAQTPQRPVADGGSRHLASLGLPYNPMQRLTCVRGSQYIGRRQRQGGFGT